MTTDPNTTIAEAKAAALKVLLHNARGPYHGLPRTAAWGYPQPYTRDLMIASLGILLSRNEALLDALRRTLIALARNQTRLGHIVSVAHDPEDRGASDTTPWFLVALGLYRHVMGEPEFLGEAAHKALTWMRYQSPDDLVMVGQLPTTDWRDEQWALGYGLYVNTIVYAYLRIYGHHEDAALLRNLMNRLDIRRDRPERHIHEGLMVRHKPYFALCAWKIDNSERFDLLGNCLAVLTGIASPTRSDRLIAWVEAECRALRARGELAVDLPPNLMPYIQPGAADWRPRYEHFNLPGEYHNGGVWPFICGFYVAACVAAGRLELARRMLFALTELVRPTRERDVPWGFNEWIKAQTGRPMGHDWQTWSAAMYLYATTCVEEQRTPFFDQLVRRPKARAARPSS
ncbi:MAG: amylo-alpha-1,6-glucosidase [Planctomycetes bacterium RBG_16_64_10]|nr:MAG: amylo-alpha-1,6-glucosidase [Planctomycetes bacterium RBG_16_64_10]